MKFFLSSVPFAIAAFMMNSAVAMDSAQLQELAEQRLAGDRSGACFAVALVEDSISVARVCADPAKVDSIRPNRAFEIGSVTKTLTTALLAKMIAEGSASLDDPLSKWMPVGTVVPAFGDKKILLRHVVTHTSGLPALPPNVTIVDPANPYALMTSAQLHESLAKVTLTHAPGTTFKYSNFAFMLLSDALARRAGVSFDALLDRDIFGKLAMNGAYVGNPPTGILAAVGHLPGGEETSSWNFAPALAGVGGVRATLDDMVHYLQAHLGRRPSSLDPALELTRERVNVGGDVAMGMGWMLVPLSGRTIQVHEGGTGGFSSFVAVDRERRRGVVILSNTALASSGGLGSFGLHLLDPSTPIGKPVKEVAAPAELLNALKGEYRLANGMEMTLSVVEGSLAAQVPGQPQLLLAHDDTGVFYPKGVDAVLRPQRQPGGGYSFTWLQGGGAIEAVRLTKNDDVQNTTASTADLTAYEGEYPLLPGFSLKVFTQDGKLFIQGTGQPSLPIDPAGTDIFVNTVVGVEIRFERAQDEKIQALTLLQNGQKLRGKRL